MNKFEHKARILQAAYEKKAQRKYMGYKPQPWDSIGAECQQEHLNIVTAVLNGANEYNGKKIPTWVKDIVQEPSSIHGNF